MWPHVNDKRTINWSATRWQLNSCYKKCASKSFYGITLCNWLGTPANGTQWNHVQLRVLQGRKLVKDSFWFQVLESLPDISVLSILKCPLNFILNMLTTFKHMLKLKVSAQTKPKFTLEISFNILSRKSNLKFWDNLNVMLSAHCI